MHSIEHYCNTHRPVDWAKPSPAKSTIFSTQFCTGKSSFLGSSSQGGIRMQFFRVCSQRQTCPHWAWLAEKSQRKQNIFLLSSRAWSDLVNNKTWAPSVNGYALPLLSGFLKYIRKHSASSLLPPCSRIGLYNQSNIQFLKIAAACAIILCLFFMANVWKALIATHFSVRLAFFQEFFSSVSLAWQTKDFAPLGNKTNVFQGNSRWALPA